MKEPNYPTEQPKDPVADALTDRNSDPDAQVQSQDAPLKVHGDAVLHGTSTARGDKQDDERRDERR
jgi:hypothetical protein